MTLDDRELLDRSGNGDREAFGLFVGRHEAAVLRLARALTRNASAAEDAFQEAFFAAWRHASGFRREAAQARPWLLAIARNAVYRQFRRRSGEPPDAMPLDELGDAAGWGAVDSGLEERLANRDVVLRALSSLRHEDREVLLLRDVEGLTGREVAAILGTSLPAVKSRLHRARLRLLAALRRTHDV